MGAIDEFLDDCRDVMYDPDPEDWSVSWSEVRCQPGSIELRLCIEAPSGEGGSRIWRVRSEGVREARLTAGQDTGSYPPHSPVVLLDDHILLWGHNEPTSQLSVLVRGPTAKREALLWGLHDRHFSLVADWIPFSRYINGYFCHNRLSSGSGVLALGPHRLLAEYASVFEGSDVEAYFPYPPTPAVHWDEKRGWISNDRDLRVLILGNSYIIADAFEADRGE